MDNATDTETPEPQADGANEAADEDLKRRLLSRIAIAAVVVVGLLGSLAMFDAMYAPPKPVPARVAKVEPPPAEPARTEVPKEEPKPAEAAPEAKPEAAAEAKPEAKPETKVEAKAEPEGTRAPGAPPLQPSPREKPLTKPATARQAVVHPPAPVAPPPAASPAARPDAAKEVARATAPRHAPLSKPLTQAAERNFALQMGVFSNLANAEDMRAKLEMNGIPTTVEARVHVGPFHSREEAEAAREKIKALGMDGGILLTLRK